MFPQSVCFLRLLLIFDSLRVFPSLDAKCTVHSATLIVVAEIRYGYCIIHYSFRCGSLTQIIGCEVMDEDVDRKFKTCS